MIETYSALYVIIGLILSFFMTRYLNNTSPLSHSDCEKGIVFIVIWFFWPIILCLFIGYFICKSIGRFL